MTLLHHNKGFTLMEIVVVMGIIALMTGILIPMVYKVWESQEVDTTEERLLAIKKAMVGNPSQISNGVRSNFGFAGDLGQLPPDLNSLISYTNENGTFGPYLEGGINPDSFRKDAWGYDFIYNYFIDPFSRRESATITSLGSDNTAGGDETAADIQVSISQNEVLPAASAAFNILVRYITAPLATFNSNITVHLVYKDGEGGDTEQTFSSLVTITGNIGNPQNNYQFGLNAALSQNIPVGMLKIWAEMDRDSTGNPLIPPASGPVTYIAVNDRNSVIYANNLSVSAP